MGKIPKVQKGIEHSLRRTLESMKRADDAGLSYLGTFWETFKEDQPHLAKLVLREMNSFKNNKAAAAFAHGLLMQHSSLKRRLMR